MDSLQRTEYLARIRRSAASVHNIIETFLDASDVRAGALQPATAVIPFRPFIDELCRLCAPMVLGREMRIDVAADLFVAADPSLLERILVNLVANAHGYSPPGKEIALSATRRGNEVVIVVADKGPGIPERVRERIFDSFWRPQGQDRRGSGIGLALARDLVGVMNGRIWVEGGKGEGSRFCVSLPVAVDDAGQEESRPGQAADGPDRRVG